MPRVAVQNLPYSLAFNGASSKVALAQTSGLPIYNATGYSVAMWAKVNNFNSEHALYAEGLTSTTTPLLSIYSAAADNCLGVFLRNSAGTTKLNAVKTTTRIRAGEWVHIVWVDIAGKCSMYINGALDATNFNYSPSGTYGFNTTTFGAQVRTSITNFLFGNMCSGQLFNYGLSSQQVLAVMNGALKGNVGSYCLTEGTGTAANDASGNGNNGVIENGTWSTDTPSKLRTVATNRVTVQDMNCALSLRTATSIVDCGTDPIGTGDVTVMGWIKAFTFGGTNQGRLLGNQKFLVRITSLNSLYAYNDGATSVSSGNNSISLNKWYHVGITRKASGAITFYIHGALVGTPDQISVAPVAATANLLLGNSSALIHNFDGLMKNWVTVNRICSQSEIQAHRNGITPSDATRIYKMNEGTGSTIYDSSGSGVNGSITNGTFVSDTPTKKRQIVGGNLIYNGDFEYAPPFTAATNTSSRWIDGTATGSTTNKLFGWYGYVLSAANTARFDTSVCHSGGKSLKIAGDTLDAEVFSSDIATTVNMIKVNPNTSYTVRGWIKANKISGAGSGACLAVSQRKSDGIWTGVGDSLSAFVSSTTDWVERTITLTTGATCQYIIVKARNLCLVGGNLVMDAWFDDITLTKTTPDTRTAVS